MSKPNEINHVDLLFPSRYLKAADLQGRDVKVSIESIEPRHELRSQRGKEEKPVVSLKGKEKMWVLNKTNAYLIADIHGKELEGWIGKEVILYPTRVQCGRQLVDAVRVRSATELGVHNTSSSQQGE